MIANWYRRNILIAANLRSLLVDGDRIVVIYGAGHIGPLQHLLSTTPRLRVELAGSVLLGP